MKTTKNTIVIKKLQKNTKSFKLKCNFILKISIQNINKNYNCMSVLLN